MPSDSIIERIEYRQNNSVDPVTFLQDAGVIEETAEAEQLVLTSSFLDDLREAIAAIGDDSIGEATIAEIFGRDESQVTRQNRPYPAFKIRYTVRPWPSENALRFDAAAHRTIDTFTDDWMAVPPVQRYRILQSLRSFQDVCLFCGGTVAIDEEPVTSCCSDRKVLRVYCTDCETRFMEFNQEADTNAIGSFS